MGLSDSIVERSPDGIVVVSEDGEILGYNERFRAGSTTSRGGHGLGLYMIEEVVEAHGWSLSLSESEEGGAAFDIEDVEVSADA